MKIQLRLYADFEENMPTTLEEDGSASVEFKEGTEVKDILDRYNISYEDAYVILLNGRHAKKEALLIEGAELCIFPPIVGG